METIIVDNNGCNDRSFTVLNLTRFVNLKVFEVGDYSFSYVDEVHMIGLPELERVVIGENSFTKHKNGWINNPNRHFYSNLSGELYVKDCDKLRELRIAESSFISYVSCAIEDNARLEVVEMGQLYEWGYNFFYASLEMKSCYDD